MHACQDASVVFNSLRPNGLYPARLLCPWDSAGKNTGVSCHFLLQGIFLAQGSNSHFLCLLHGQVDSLTLAPPGKLVKILQYFYGLKYFNLDHLLLQYHPEIIPQPFHKKKESSKLILFSTFPFYSF